MKSVRALVMAGMFAIGLASLSARAESDPAASKPDRQHAVSSSTLEPGFRWVFNGRDLKGWHKNPQPIGHGTGGDWTVEQGAITGQQDPPGSGNGGILLTDEAFGDFEAIFEVQIDWGCDSGFFVRSNEKGQCYQVLVDFHDNGNMAEIYREGLDGATNRTYRLDGVLAEGALKQINVTPLTSGDVKPSLTQGEFRKLWNATGWNSIRVRVVGNPPTITTCLNGRRITQYTSEQKFAGTLGDRGRLAVQVHGGAGLWPKGAKVRYRHIQVKELAAPGASQPASAPASGPSNPEAYVRPVDLKRLQAGYDALSGRSRELVSLYMEAARREVLAETDGCYPHQGSMLYRNFGERAKGAAILSVFKSDWPEELRQRCRSESARLVAEVASAHAKKPSFGDAWQGPLHVSEAGMAAWFLWDELDPAVKHGAAKMVAYEADRLAATRPKMEYRGDTQAETVAWNSALLGVAVNMMPQHPHAAEWEQALKLYLYNTLAAPQDVRDESPGDDGKPVNRWILGANIHEDFALENHNQFHVDYMLTCYRFHLLVASCYQAAGRPLPKAIHHHARNMYEKVMLGCMDHDGFFEYVSDNDWKRYHAWTESATVHSYMAFLENSPLSAALETRALRKATSYWREFPAGWSYDNPYVCGKPWTPRIAEAVLLHLTASGQMPAPLPDEQVNAKLTGVREVKSVRLLTQMSPGGSLRSYYAGPGRSIVRFVTPAQNSWMLLPLGTNYGSPTGDRPPKNAGEMRSEYGVDWFWVVRTSAKGGEAFISLPDETVIDLQLQGEGDKPGAAVERAIGVEKPHRPIHVWFDGGGGAWKPGRTAWSRTDGSVDTVARSKWINLDDAIGYVAVNDAADAEATWLLPDPTKRSALKRRVAPSGKNRLADGLIIFPGQGHEDTARAAQQAKLSVSGGVVQVTVGEWIVWANVTENPATVESAESGAPVELPARTATATRSGRRVF